MTRSAKISFRMNLRPSTSREWNKDGFTKAAKESFYRNAASQDMGNQAPDSIKTPKTLKFAKKGI